MFSGVAPGGWEEWPGARSGQVPLPHQREPADKSPVAKAVVEDAGNEWAVEEDVFLESNEEVCSVSDGNSVAYFRKGDG